MSGGATLASRPDSRQKQAPSILPTCKLFVLISGECFVPSIPRSKGHFRYCRAAQMRRSRPTDFIRCFKVVKAHAASMVLCIISFLMHLDMYAYIHTSKFIDTRICPCKFIYRDTPIYTPHVCTFTELHVMYKPNSIHIHRPHIHIPVHLARICVVHIHVIHIHM